MNYYEIKAISASALKMATSDIEIYNNIVNPNVETTKSMEFGKLVHLMLLEREKLNEYKRLTLSDVGKLNKDGSLSLTDAKNKELLRDLEGTKFLLPSEVESLNEIERNMKPLLNKYNLFSDEGNYENEFHLSIDNELNFSNEITEWGGKNIMPIKAKPDYYHNNVLIDIKTCQAADYEHFRRDFYKYEYHLQLAFYKDILEFYVGKIYEVYILAIENNGLYLPNLFLINETTLEAGRELYRKRLRMLFDGVNQGFNGHLNEEIGII